MWSNARSFPVNRVLVIHKDVPQKAIDILAKRCEIEFVDGNHPTKSQIIEAARGAAAKPGGLTSIFWWTTGTRRLDEDILDAAGPNLRFISGMSSGLDFMDIQAIRRRKIMLGHARYVSDPSVANIAIGLLLSASRRFREGRFAIEAGLNTEDGEHYSPSWMLGQDLTDSTVGIVGLGGIGSAIAQRLKSFQVSRIVYCGRSDKPNARDLDVQRVPFSELLSASDFVVVACPLTQETKGMFNAEAFRKMKKTATFVNVGRGQVVDQDALIHALKTGEIFAAGLDTVTPEPLPNDHPLLSLVNAVVIPHLGSATAKTREDMAVLAAENILAGIEGRPMPCPAKQ